MKKGQRETRKTVKALLSGLGDAVTPPVPVERVARSLGIELRYEPFDGELSGMLFKEKGHTIIGVNSLHSRTRQRFTIAHELGHFVLHGNKDMFVDKNYRVRHRDQLSSAAVDPEEIQANRFAAEMLMPYHLLCEDIVNLDLDFENDNAIEQLASRYKVSTQAMTFRLSNTRLVDLEETS